MTDIQSNDKADGTFQTERTLYFGLYNSIVRRIMVDSKKKK